MKITLGLKMGNGLFRWGNYLMLQLTSLHEMNIIYIET